MQGPGPLPGSCAMWRTTATALCSSGGGGSTSGASAWIQLNGGNTDDYAQIGYAMTTSIFEPDLFTEWSYDAPHWQRDWFGGIWDGMSNRTYTVTKGFSTGKISMTVDGSTKTTTTWSPDTLWGSGWWGAFEGETLDHGDDVPGTAASKVLYSARR